MKQINTTVCQYREKLAWGRPNPITNQIGRYLGNEGANLPNSVTEDVVGINLCRKYSRKQLRRINRVHSADNILVRQKTIHKAAIHKFANRRLRLKGALAEECMW